MDIKEIMEINPKTLAEIQHKELKRHTLKILNKIKSLVENEKYEEIEEYLFSSPAGDGYGLDNDCIDFDYGVNGDEGMDVKEVTDRLAALKNQIK